MATDRDGLRGTASLFLTIQHLLLEGFSKHLGCVAALRLYFLLFNTK